MGVAYYSYNRNQAEISRDQFRGGDKTFIILRTFIQLSSYYSKGYNYCGPGEAQPILKPFV